MFARTTVHIGSWSARMAFVVLHTGAPLVLGMPFFDRFEPHILWRRREYLIHEGNTTHVLSADLLPPAYGPAAAPLLLPNLRPANVSPCLPILPSGDACFFTAANVDVTTLVEPSAHDRTEIERLVDLAQDRVIHGKTIPKPIKNAETPYHPDILKLLDEFADVFPDNLPLGLPGPRETDHFIDLVEHAKPPAHRVYRLSTAGEIELKRQLEAYLAWPD